VARGTSTATRRVESASLYVLDTWILSPQLEVFGGLRHDEYDIEAANIVNDYVDAASQLHSRASFLNGHAGLVFKPAKNGSLYLSYGSSSNPSGEQLDAGAADYGSISGDRM
jgi:catecholate siderophore receptor